MRYLLIILTLVIATSASADYFEDFENVDNWKANNSKAPAEFRSDGEHLILIDPPGGEVTWGTSVYDKPREIDLDKTPYFVAKLAESTGTFSVTLVNRETGKKDKAIGSAKEPGVYVVDIRRKLRWSGKKTIGVGLYVNSTEKMVKVDWIKFTGTLTDEERAALKKSTGGIPEPYHGLKTLATRRGWRRLDDTKRGDTWLSERLVYKDTVTGNEVWRMTCDPAVDCNDYYDIPAWNADGSVMGFLTRRAGAKARWLMDANGGNLRPMLTADGQPVGSGFWSVIRRDRFYQYDVVDGKTRVLALNPFTGERSVIVTASTVLGSMMPPHPSEEWFLFGARKKDVQEGSLAYVLGLDGSLRTVDLEKRWHRLRFTTAPDQRLFFNFDNPRTQWTIMPDGSQRCSIPESGGHPGWLPGGQELTYYEGGDIRAISFDGKRKRMIYKGFGGGHGASCLDGEWFVSDTGKGGPYPQSVVAIPTDGSQKANHVCKTMTSTYSHDNAEWHPDHHTSHAHPASSPDGTKALFNSDYMSQYTDIYVAVVRKPDAPRELKIARKGDSVTLSWQPGKNHRETRGYHVYRGGVSPKSYARITMSPLAEPRWTLSDRNASYVVTAIEHSGLESGPSNVVGDPAAFTERESIVLDSMPPARPNPPFPHPKNAEERAFIKAGVYPVREMVWITQPNPNTVALKWLPSPSVDVDHYNVYASYHQARVSDVSTLIGSPVETEFVDWGVPLDSRIAYDVSAVDIAGNETYYWRWVTNERSVLTPQTVKLSADTLDDGFKTGGQGTWSFDLARGGEFAIWGKAIQEVKQRSSFDVVIDNKKKRGWQAFGPWGEWSWSAIGTMKTGTPELIQLKAGRHTLRLKSRTKTARFAELVITDDPSFMPVEGMSRMIPLGSR